MSRPTDVSDFGEAVYSQLAPVADQDENNAWALLIFVAALGEMYRVMDELAHSDPPWSRIIDVDNVPAEGLPWLGQLNGTVVNANLIESDQRDQIRNRQSWNRGTLTALKQSIQYLLTGTKTVVIQERDTSAYHFSISTYSDESPADTTYNHLYSNFATYDDFYATYLSYQAYWLVDGREQIQLLIALNKPAALQFTYSVISGHP